MKKDYIKEELNKLSEIHDISIHKLKRLFKACLNNYDKKTIESIFSGLRFGLDRKKFEIIYLKLIFLACEKRPINVPIKILGSKKIPYYQTEEEMFIEKYTIDSLSKQEKEILKKLNDEKINKQS